MNILKDNNRYQFFNELTIIKNLEPKNYQFKYDEFGNCWLEDMPDFILPEKVYDIHSDLLELIAITQQKETTNLGTLLSGNKGQGKSLLAKQICKRLNLPTILITKPIPSEINFIEFLGKIEQDFVLNVDEFEKLFKEGTSSNNYVNNSNQKTDYHTQESFLSFMDGSLSGQNRVFFLLTTNDQVNSFLLNRPSRIKFLLEFNEMPEELFNMIVDDRLLNKEFKQDLEDNVSLININIDLLIHIINTINMINKPFSQFSKYFNYVYENYKYEVYITKNGKEIMDSFFNSEKKLRTTDKYMAHHQVHQLIKFTKEEIIFESSDWDDKEEKNIPIKVKLIPAKLGGSIINVL